MTRRRMIRRQKKIHEARRYIHAAEMQIYQYTEICARIDRITTRIATNGVGSIYMPSVNIFQHLSPMSPPQGIIFNDGSFLVFKEIFHYDYLSEDVPGPTIVHFEYSFHYQIPERTFFFRYDFHPEVGDRLTHPAYHLHAGGWLNETDSLPSVPRFPASDMTLGEVLELIQVNFFLN